jgi:hypothetical protein
MRAFIVACLAIVVIGAGGYFGLNATQQSTGIAYSTDGARINPKWTWRSVFHLTKKAPTGQTAMDIDTATGRTPVVEECDSRTAWQWIFVDFGTPEGEPETCSASQ